MTKMTLPSHIAQFVESRIPSMKSAFDVVVATDDIEELAEIDIKLGATVQLMRVLRGFIYRRWRELDGDGTWLAHLQNLGIPKSTAYDYIDEATVFEKAGSIEGCEKLAGFPSKKLRTFKHLEAPELSVFIQGEPVRGITMDDARTMERSDLNKLLKATEEELSIIEDNKRLQAELAEQQEKNHIAAMELTALQQQVSEGSRMRQWPEAYAVAGGQLEIISEKTMVLLEQLAALLARVNQHVSQAALGGELSDTEQQALEALGKLMRVRVGGNLCMLQELYEDIRHSSYGDDMQRVGLPQLAISLDEQAEIAKARMIMQQDIETQLEIARANAVPRRGRPRKDAQ